MARRGRPLKAPTPGQRVGMSLRITPETKARLEKAANRSGRSLSQEAELRIEQSFQKEAVSDAFTAVVDVMNQKLDSIWNRISEPPNQEDGPGTLTIQAKKGLVHMQPKKK